MKETTLEGQAKKALLECLREVPFLRVKIREGSSGMYSGADFFVQIRMSEHRMTLIVEVQRIGQPRIVREAANRLLRFKDSLPDSYGVVMAPYISPQAAELCTKEGFGFADLAGNCLLSFDQVFISKEGKKNPFARKRDLRSLYSPKAERVLRVLLSAPGRWWKVKSLADTAGVSLGQSFNVKKLLLDREWIEAGRKEFRLNAPADLLAEWDLNYRFRRSTVREYYTLGSIADAERMVAEACERDKIPYALAGFSSAARYAAMVRYQRATAYVHGDPDAVAGHQKLKPVTSGANVSLISPYDEGVLYGSQVIDKTRVTSPVQTYLDLRQIKERGEEAAEFLMQQVIEPSWLKNE